MTPQSPLTAINPNNISQDSACFRSLRALPGTPTLTGWPIAIVSGRSYSQEFRPSATASAPFMRHRAMVISTQ